MTARLTFKTRRVCASSFLALILATSPAFATASVTNRDEKDHKITIIEGDKKRDYTLKPNEELKDICTSGCVLRLNDSDDDEYQLEPKDIVSIEDNNLYYDNEDTDAEKTDDTKKK